jgi:hypothetical protein
MLMAVAAMTVLSACGPAFPGTYSGALHGVFACPSGYGGAGDINATWVLTQSNKAISIAATGGSCNPLGATIGTDLDSATIDSKTCPALPDQFGGTITESLLDGTLTLDNSGDLAVSIRATEFFHDPGYEDEICPSVFFGTFTRQKTP